MGGYDNIKYGMYYYSIQEINHGIYNNRFSDQRDPNGKKVTRKTLSYGICSEHVLQELESDRYAADVLMLDILLQRLGQSPDKFEMVLGSKLFNMIRLRDLIEEAVYRGKRKLAELLLQNYPSRTHVDAMYHHRMEAFLIYHMDGNCALAADYLHKAISRTLPEYSYEYFYDQMEHYLISTAELENLLALERMYLEGYPGDSTIRSISKQHLERCMDYIENHFSDDEECAKLVGKCAWLTAGICYLEKDYVQTIVFCKKGYRETAKKYDSIFCTAFARTDGPIRSGAWHRSGTEQMGTVL